MGFFGSFSRFWEDLGFCFIDLGLFSTFRFCTGLHGVARGCTGLHGVGLFSAPIFFVFWVFLSKIIKITIDFNGFLVIFGIVLVEFGCVFTEKTGFLGLPKVHGVARGCTGLHGVVGRKF